MDNKILIPSKNFKQILISEQNFIVRFSYEIFFQSISTNFLKFYLINFLVIIKNKNNSKIAIY